MDLETKYTPHNLSQYQITDPALRNIVNRYLSGKLTRPLLLYGEPGTGKSLLGHLLLNSICPDVQPQHIMEIEVGLDGSVNVARKVDLFASTVKPTRWTTPASCWTRLTASRRKVWTR